MNEKDHTTGGKQPLTRSSIPINYVDSLINASFDAVIVTDLHGMILNASDIALRMFAIGDREELKGKGIYDFLIQEEHPVALSNIKKLVRFTRPLSYEYTTLTTEGQTMVCQVRSAVLRSAEGEAQGLVITIRDITKQRRDEQLRKALYEISQSAYNTLNLFELYGAVHKIVNKLLPAENFYIALHRPETNELAFPYFVDKYETSGTPQAIDYEQYGNSLTEYLIRQGEPLLLNRDSFQKLADKGEVDFIGGDSHEWLGVPLKTSEGETFGALAVQMYDESSHYAPDDKNILAFVSTQIAMAIERKQSEERLRENEKLFRSVTETTQALVFIIHGEHIVYMNKYGQEYLGLTLEEIRSKKFWEFLHPSQSEKIIQNAIARLRGEKVPTRYQFMLLHGGGEYRWIDYSATFIEYEGQPAILGNAFDITQQRQLIEALKDSEEKLRGFFEQSLEGISIVEDDGSIAEWNYANEQMTGIPRNEAVGQLVWDVIFRMTREERQTPEVYESLKNDWQEALQKGDAAKLNHKALLTIRNRSGELVYFRFYAFTITSEKNIRIGTIVHNLTDRMRAEEEIVKLSHAIEQSSASVIMTDPDGVIEYVNRKFTEITGYSPGEALGKKPSLLKSEQTDPKVYAELWETITAGHEWQGEFLNKKRSGELYWDFGSISPIKNNSGEITHFVAVKEDITERKKLEQDLIKAKNEAEENSKLKSNLLNNMNHEFRTPMNGIIGFASILAEELDDTVHSDMVMKIHTSAQRLMSTLNAVLELSQVEITPGSFQGTTIYVNQFISELLEEFDSDARQKELYLRLEDASTDGYVYVVSDMFRKILNNLVDNALKYTSQGGVGITIENITGDGQPKCAIHVTDTGIGIPPDKHDIIFHEFRQVSEGLSRSYEGAGLGLTLARKMAQLMHGEISVKSEPGKGSVFTITFPSAQPVEEEKPLPKPREAKASQKVSRESLPVALIVEDNKINRDVAEVFLRRTCKLDMAANGLDAVEKASKRQYPFILMDINLGSGINGVEAAKRIREIEGYENTPIVAVTGYAAASDKENILQDGACTHYLNKPFSKKQLVGIVREVMELVEST